MSETRPHLDDHCRFRFCEPSHSYISFYAHPLKFSTTRDELIRLRAIKPPLGARKDADNIPPEVPVSMDTDSTVDESMATQPPSECSEDDPVTNTPAPSTADDDSCEAVGKEEAAALDRDMMTDENSSDEEEEPAQESSVKVSTMFQRLLNMNAGQIILGDTQQNSSATPANTPFRASISQNGRLICNLPDHPIHAGATAIVAVLSIVTKTLTVANAGDSRAVLCRGGSTVPLSFDHKPMQETELSRIQKAGGFVNAFGRVNGNLNLSRSIGDLKYKQVPGIPPADQMITAEPDIVQ